MDAFGYYILTEKSLPPNLNKVSAPYFFRCVHYSQVQSLGKAFYLRNFFTTLSEFDDQERLRIKMELRNQSDLLRLKKIFIVVDKIQPSYHQVTEQQQTYHFKEFFGSCFTNEAPDIFYSPATLSG